MARGARRGAEAGATALLGLLGVLWTAPAAGLQPEPPAGRDMHGRGLTGVWTVRVVGHGAAVRFDVRLEHDGAAHRVAWRSVPAPSAHPLNRIPPLAPLHRRLADGESLRLRGGPRLEGGAGPAPDLVLEWRTWDRLAGWYHGSSTNADGVEDGLRFLITAERTVPSVTRVGLLHRWTRGAPDDEELLPPRLTRGGWLRRSRAGTGTYLVLLGHHLPADGPGARAHPYPLTTEAPGVHFSLLEAHPGLLVAEIHLNEEATPGAVDVVVGDRLFPQTFVLLEDPESALSPVRPMPGWGRPLSDTVRTSP